ncbi:hypothetical protein BSN82_06255 [Acinetobacter baylyi]|uniref:Uncharacterized protein n=1 Tax=Acinetobacter baylyi (strain ATCC 33305 / BD413 / ADP1) TaxID=62977 RepID=Q6F6V7_ACIAD|nr:hypothetical protein BSL88_06945 [Acinetobacter baylyi]CAG70208.1 hypothetical protein ACIAD3566 [Acinetobacter baylyi ADP1]KAF2374820.1 hypothetical protein BSL67_05840 [Acinetobacter baylyi]KAF2378983.1 hypothetical protein BSN81_00345 [Acinetobacter baylyi]KAF2381954.1 hypothetical protein BSN83_05680 [Acinetobacter baylyi]
MHPKQNITLSPLNRLISWVKQKSIFVSKSIMERFFEKKRVQKAYSDTYCRNIILSLHFFINQKNRSDRDDHCWRVITKNYASKLADFNFFLPDTFQNLSFFLANKSH